MAQATVSEIKNRIVTLCGQISGIETALDDYPEDNEPFSPGELPAIVVRVGAAVYEKQSNHRVIMTREYVLIFHAIHIGNDAQEPDTDALEAIEPYLVSVPVFFDARPRLESTGLAGLAIYGNTLVSDTGPQRIIREGAVYVGTIFTLTVSTGHNT